MGWNSLRKRYRLLKRNLRGHPVVTSSKEEGEMGIAQHCKPNSLFLIVDVDVSLVITLVSSPIIFNQ